MVRVSDILQITTIVVLFLLHYTLFDRVVDAVMRALLALLSATSLPVSISYTVMLFRPVEREVRATLAYEAMKATLIYTAATAAGLLAS
jgi:hypothetical protein